MEIFAQSIVETIRHPVVVIDRDFKILSCNPAFLKNFGLRADQVNEMSIFDCPDLNVSALKKKLTRILTDNTTFSEFEIHTKLRDDKPRFLSINARKIRDNETERDAIFIAIEDVTQAHETKNELQRLNRELEQRIAARTLELQASNRELEAFCYSVSHDLRAPLRAIDGFSSELEYSYKEQLDDCGKHYIERIRANTQKMGQLIDDLLQLSRLSRSEMRWQQVDFSALAQQLAEELRQQNPERNVDIKIQKGMSACGDSGLLAIALTNLILNAWKFTSKVEHATIEIGEKNSDTECTFFVRDNGAGFDPAHKDKLFGAFQRLHSEKEYPGNGIGLATVKRIIRRHGGTVWAKGQVGYGATFYFTIPNEKSSYAKQSNIASRG